MDLEIGTIGARPGDRRLDPSLTVHNAALQPLRITGAVLTTGAGRFVSARAPGTGEDAFTVAPGETKRVALPFDLPRPAGDVLVDPVALTISVRAGDRSREVAIPLTR